WFVHAQIDEDKKIIFDFYNTLMRDAGLAQTQYMSVPNGYGADYSDEEYSISFVIEKKSTDEITQIKITIHRLK
ncbi:hypothetical protein IIA79_08125, partial [bacterium]|nr:hypothetical protein [bacterium]